MFALNDGFINPIHILFLAIILFLLYLCHYFFMSSFNSSMRIFPKDISKIMISLNPIIQYLLQILLLKIDDGIGDQLHLDHEEPNAIDHNNYKDGSNTEL
jgi:hypothetical protein